jgi:hypothetical protein
MQAMVKRVAPLIPVGGKSACAPRRTPFPLRSLSSVPSGNALSQNALEGIGFPERLAVPLTGKGS